MPHTIQGDLSPTRRAVPKKTETSAGEDEKKRKYCARLIGMENGTAAMENRVDVPPP